MVQERGVPILESRLIPLIKDGTLREHNTLCRWIVEAPTLVTIRIANEDAFQHMRLQLSPDITLDINIGLAAPNAQVREIRLLPIPQFIWSRLERFTTR